MPGGKVIIHLDDEQELFDIDDFNSITVADLLKRAKVRFYGDLTGLITDSSECLCEGPYATTGLDDVRFRAIVQMFQPGLPQHNFDQESIIVHKPIKLWFCHCLNNGFLLANTTTTNGQLHPVDTVSIDNNHISDCVPLLTTCSKSDEPSQASTDVRLVQNNPNQDIPPELASLFEEYETYMKFLKENLGSSDAIDESSEERGLTFINGFRSLQKKQYRTDFLPKKKKKAKKKEATSQTTSKKRKKYTKSKQYAFYLQAVDSNKRSGDDKYTHLQLTKNDLDLLQKGETVSFYIAVTKKIKGRLYLAALKGFLTDKKNPQMPLENPCIVTFEWINPTESPPKTFPLKLVLIQVSGDANRKSKTEFNETFRFDQRTVDESSKYSDYDTADDTDEPGEFQISVVRAKGDGLLEADWSSLIESDNISYNICKSKKKQKKEAPVASTSVQRKLETTQDNEEETDEDDEEREEDEDEDNDNEENPLENQFRFIINEINA